MCGLVPEVARDDCGDDEAHDGHQYHVVFLLELEHRITVQVGQINTFALRLDVRMFATQQPAHVREEESTLGIVRIRLCLTELVMDTVISGPVNNSVLCTHRITIITHHTRTSATSNTRLYCWLQIYLMCRISIGNQVSKQQHCVVHYLLYYTWNANVLHIMRNTRSGHFAL